MKPIYSSHGGRHQVAVVHCPRILGNRLAHLSQDGPNSWVIRDFITGMMIRNSFRRCGFPAAARSGRVELVSVDAKLLQDGVEGSDGDVPGVAGDDSRQVLARIGPDFVAALALTPALASQLPELTRHLTIGHAGTMTDTRRGVRNGLSFAGSG